uniref:Alpha/beta hydrolase fold-3 domain-containing protein n=1 Tax=Salvator merianae TaxID=96440 RepID=A0A8D0BPA4_SALMN
MIHTETLLSCEDKKCRDSEQLGFLWALSWLASIMLAAVLLLVLWSILFHFSTTEIPAGISQPLKLRCLHCLILMTIGLVCLCWWFRLYFKCKQKVSLSIKDLRFDGVPVRMYQPKTLRGGPWRTILYFHGGAGHFGSVDHHLCTPNEWYTSSYLFNHRYRLSPEHPYPALLTDCLTATEHLMTHCEDYAVDSNSIIISGDSCGGTIAALVCQHLLGKPGFPKPRAQILIYPFLQAVDFNLPSYQKNQNKPLLTRRQVVENIVQCLQQDMSLVDKALNGSHISQEKKMRYQKWLHPEIIPEALKTHGCRQVSPPSPESFLDDEKIKEAFEMISPLLAEDSVIRQLPECYILTCTNDALMDDGLLYKKRLEDNGVRVTWYQLEDGFHGVLFFINHWLFHFSAAKQGLDSVVAFINNL